MSANRDLSWTSDIEEMSTTRTTRFAVGEVSMTVQTFRDLLKAQPFRPFRLVMSSGEKYDVKHPEMAMLMRTDIMIGIEESRDGLPTRFKICSYLHVTAIEPIDGPVGARRKR